MAEQISLGMPVEIGSIDRELKKLWDQGASALTRASLVNFAVYCRGREAMARNTQLISQFMQEHACRAILIGVEPEAATTKVQAWIDAHCHITREGAKQICCEQISFLLEGDAGGLIPNIVFSHLDSDLPLYLWWQGDFTGVDEATDKQLWARVDRLFFDSSEFSQPREQFRFMNTQIVTAAPRLVLCDLNWGRSLGLRQAIAQLFESPSNLAQLSSIRRVSLSYAPGFRTTAALMAGWMISQLHWSQGGQNSLQAVHAPGNEMLQLSGIELELHEVEGAPLRECVLQGESFSFRLSRGIESAFWHADISLPDGGGYHHLFPTGKSDALSLLDEELMLGGKHLVYLKALRAAEPLLSR